MSLNLSKGMFENELHKTIRTMLIDLRKKHNFTQRELSKRLSVPQSFISKVELGQRTLDIVELNRYIKEFNLDLTSFISEINL